MRYFVFLAFAIALPLNPLMAGNASDGVAMKAYTGCVVDQVKALDDLASDAKTIALAVSQSCRQQYIASLDEHMWGEAESTKRAFLSAALQPDREMQLPLSIVLSMRRGASKK